MKHIASLLLFAASFAVARSPVTHGSVTLVTGSSPQGDYNCFISSSNPQVIAFRVTLRLHFGTAGKEFSISQTAQTLRIPTSWAIATFALRSNTTVDAIDVEELTVLDTLNFSAPEN